MSTIINDISIGINIIQGLISLAQKATHPLINNENVNALLSQAHSYSEEMRNKHLVCAPSTDDNNKID